MVVYVVCVWFILVLLGGLGVYCVRHSYACLFWDGGFWCLYLLVGVLGYWLLMWLICLLGFAGLRGLGLVVGLDL